MLKGIGVKKGSSKEYIVETGAGVVCVGSRAEVLLDKLLEGSEVIEVDRKMYLSRKRAGLREDCIAKEVLIKDVEMIEDSNINCGLLLDELWDVVSGTYVNYPLPDLDVLKDLIDRDGVFILCGMLAKDTLMNLIKLDIFTKEEMTDYLKQMKHKKNKVVCMCKETFIDKESVVITSF